MGILSDAGCDESVKRIWKTNSPLPERENVEHITAILLVVGKLDVLLEIPLH